MFIGDARVSTLTIRRIRGATVHRATLIPSQKGGFKDFPDPIDPVVV